MITGARAITEGRGKRHEFIIQICGEEHLFRTSTVEEKEEWLKMLAKAISLARPLHLGVTTINVRTRKNRESKTLEAHELTARQRLSSGKLLPFSSLDPPAEAPPETPESERPPPKD